MTNTPPCKRYSPFPEQCIGCVGYERGCLREGYEFRTIIEGMQRTEAWAVVREQAKGMGNG